MPEFVFHWMVFGEVYDDLGLERPHRDGAQQQPFPDGEYGCLFHARSLERPFSDGVHEDVCRGMDEDTQAVGLEGVAGEAVAFHALLELPYEQLVAPAAAVGLLVEVLLADAPDVGNDEPDVELAFLGVLRLDHDPLWQEPCAGLVAELPVSPHGMVEQLVVMPHPLYGGLRGLIALQHAVPRQACDEEHAAVVQAGPVHQLVGAEVASPRTVMMVFGHASRRQAMSQRMVSSKLTALFLRPGLSSGRIILPVYPSKTISGM